MDDDNIVRHSIRPYDLLWPVKRRKEMGSNTLATVAAKVEEEVMDPKKDSRGVHFLSSRTSPPSLFL